MTTISHIMSGALIALYTSKTVPTETKYVIAAIISAGILDLDHIYYLIKDRRLFQKYGWLGNLHKARSFLHELIGFGIIGVGVLLWSFVDGKMAYVIGVASMVHLTEDMLVGISLPFNPIDATAVNLLPQKRKLKFGLEVLIIVLSGGLWIKYLNGQN